MNIKDIWIKIPTHSPGGKCMANWCGIRLFLWYCWTIASQISLQWRHNECDSDSNHQPRDCLLNVYSGADERKHQRSASLVFVRGIHRRPVNSPHKGPVTREMIPFDDVIMCKFYLPQAKPTMALAKMSMKIELAYWQKPNMTALA